MTTRRATPMAPRGEVCQLWYSNGSRIQYDRSANPSADWTHYNILSRKVFANLTTNFDNGWQVRVNGTHAESDFDSKLLYVTGYPDQTTGILDSSGYGYAGWYKGLRTQTAMDAYASGPFELLGRQHQLVAGVDYSRQRNRYLYSSTILSPAEIGNWNDWNGDVAEPDWPAGRSLLKIPSVRKPAIWLHAFR